MLNEGMQSLLAEFLTILVLRGFLCGMAYLPEFQLMYFAILGGHYLRDGKAQDAEN